MSRKSKKQLMKEKKMAIASVVIDAVNDSLRASIDGQPWKIPLIQEIARNKINAISATPLPGKFKKGGIILKANDGV